MGDSGLRYVLVAWLALSLVLPAQAVAVAERPVVDPPHSASLLQTDDDLVPTDAAPTFGPVAATTALSGDYRIDALISGYALSGTTVEYSFYEDSVFNGTYYGTEANPGEVSEEVKQNVRALMAWYGSIINVSFVEVDETPTRIGYVRFLVSDGPSYAYAYYPLGTTMFGVAGDVHLNTARHASGTFDGSAGSYGYEALAHEIGHALGLKHPFEAQGSRTTVLPTAEDNDTNTVMTYTSYTPYSATPMVYDVRALQYMYGARPKNTGDDTYRFTTQGTSQYILDATTYQDTSSWTKQALWDSGGMDTLDATALPAKSEGYRFDLRAGGWLTANEDYLTTRFKHGLSLVDGVAIENVINSSSSDTIYANGAGTVFGGYTAGRLVGDDTIIGATSSDTIDLAGYRPSRVSPSRVGDDLVLGLDGRGLVTIADYYAGSVPVLKYGENQAPDAAMTVSVASGKTPLEVTFSSTGSNDPDGMIATRSWDFGDGTSASGVYATHVYATPGVFNATLVVSDEDGATDQDVHAIAVQSNEVVVVPIAGSDRYATAVDASKRAFPLGASVVVIATGADFPDALGGAALAGVVDGPLLLTPRDWVQAGLAAELARLGATEAYVLGGPGAVSEEVEGTLRSLLPGGVTRLSGDNRYRTAERVADEVIRLSGDDFSGKAFVATGRNFPDALGASPIAASFGIPIFLTAPDGMPRLPAAVESVLVLGGSTAVTDTTWSALGSTVGWSRITRFAGQDRYETAAFVADYGTALGMKWDGVGIATGAAFPDALSGGAMLGNLDSVLLLTRSSSLPSEVSSRISGHREDISTVHFIGGTSALTDVVRTGVLRLIE